MEQLSPVNRPIGEFRMDADRRFAIPAILVATGLLASGDSLLRVVGLGVGASGVLSEEAVVYSRVLVAQAKWILNHRQHSNQTS